MNKFIRASLLVCGVSAALGLAVGVAPILFISGPGGGRAASAPVPSARQVGPRVWLAPQIRPGDLSGMRAGGIGTVVDLRPDGEEAGQPSSESMEQAAVKAGLRFAHIPVPHGYVPDAAADALARMPVPPDGILLYCRSGNRAARTWALAEASRPGGMPAERILEAVKSAGFNADDLAARIRRREAGRASIIGGSPNGG